MFNFCSVNEWIVSTTQSTVSFTFKRQYSPKTFQRIVLTLAVCVECRFLYVYSASVVHRRLFTNLQANY